MTFGFALGFVLLGHVVADFYLQTNRVARKKSERASLLVLHCGCYALCMAPFVFASLSFESVVLAWLVLSLSHALVDCGKAWLEGRIEKPLAVFCIDQAIHVLLCVVVVATLFDERPAFEIAGIFVGVMDATSVAAALGISLTLLVVWRPGAIFVRLLLESVRIKGSDIVCSGKGAANGLRTGRWIGMLERTIVAVLAFCNQFGAIAFVLTAKSIARFKMLDDKEFAECYLVGTLASTAFAILASLAVRELVAWS